MSAQERATPKVPPAWFVRIAWKVHRGLYRMSGGRFLWTPANKRGWGALRLTATGWRSGQLRSVILGYLDDGDDLVLLAMNGWQEGHPSWFRNLQAHPDATVRLSGQPERPVRARTAEGEELDRLWTMWARVEKDLEGYSAARTTDTPVVVLEPR